MTDPQDDRLQQTLVSDFRDEADDRCDVISRLIDQMAERTDTGPVSDQDVWALRREVHCLKGIASSFGFPGISLLSHRFENFIDALQAQVDRDALRSFNSYVDEIGRLVKQGDPQQEELAGILRRLPAPGTQAPDMDQRADLKAAIMVVTPSRIMSRLVAGNLARFGLSPTFCQDPVEAIGMVLRIRPDLLIASAVMDKLPGRDLIKGLRAMAATADIPVALLTSSDTEEERIARESPDLPVVRSGPRFEADFKALARRYNLL